jgi:hypothetical protein
MNACNTLQQPGFLANGGSAQAPKIKHLNIHTSKLKTLRKGTEAFELEAETGCNTYQKDWAEWELAETQNPNL